MDRNLQERLRKLSAELADAIHAYKNREIDGLSEMEAAKLDDRIADLQDEIWDIEDQLESEAADEFAERSAKGWN